MKRLLLPLALLTAVALALPAQASFDPLAPIFDGTATVKSGKKSGSLATSATADTSDGSDLTLVIAGSGPRGTKADITLTLASNGKATLRFVAKVPADPKQLRKKVSGKKVVVRTNAKGTWVANADGAYSVTLAGNSGKSGTQIKGTLSLVTTVDPMAEDTQTLSLTLNSGFKQKVDGVGRKLSFSFTGTGVIDE